MNIAVLSQLKGSPGTRVFIDHARAMGEQVELVNPLEALVLASGPMRLFRGADPDVVFTRMGGATPDIGFNVLRKLQLQGLPCVNQPAALEIARDKIKTYIELAHAGLPLPETVLSAGNVSVDQIARELGPPPWVWKRPRGAKGEDVGRVDSPQAMEALLAEWPAAERLLIQAFVHEASGRDTRVFVVGGEARAAMIRQAPEGEWRSNLHQGGTAVSVPVDREMRRVAEACALCLSLDVCGVDLLRSSDGWVVAEVNGSPGLAGLRDAVGDGPVDAVLELLRKRAL